MYIYVAGERRMGGWVLVSIASSGCVGKQHQTTKYIAKGGCCIILNQNEIIYAIYFIINV